MEEYKIRAILLTICNAIGSILIGSVYGWKIAVGIYLLVHVLRPLEKPE